MAVQFILGPAGTGKSTYVMSHVAEELRKNNQKKIIIMVPEQATFCYQYELITRYGLSGVLTLEVLSFQRLARTIMQQTGGLARENIDDLGKMLVLRRIIQDEPEQYSYFSKSINHGGYLSKLGDAIQELKRYRVSPEHIQDIVKSEKLSGSLLGNKIFELTALYTAYEAFLSQVYVDSEDTLNILSKKLEDINTLQHTEIWVDEFYDFTPQELQILGKLMQCAEQVHIVLPLDRLSHNPGRKALFRHPEKLYRELSNLAAESSVEVLPDIVFSVTKRWQPNTSLAFLEQEYFNIGSQKFSSDFEDISLIEAQNRLSEVDFVARSIRRLCREEGYRYNDIAVFTRGEQYAYLLETTFCDYDIPYFLDHKETVDQHPFTELILAVLEIIQSNWSYQSIFRFLKTGLLSFAQSEIDRLENYVLQYGIRGSTWYREEDWQYPVAYISSEEQENALRELNTLRIEIAMPIRRFQLDVDEKKSAAEIIQALYRLLEQYQVPENIERFCIEAVEYQLLEDVQVHQQIWDKLIHIFNQMTHLLQDSPMTLDAFTVILQAAVQNLNLGLLPSSLDQVFIGALAHSRVRNPKVVFVLGLNEGVFPAKTGENSFFNDNEKHALQDMGISLSHDSAESIHDEQFLIYLGLTRASEKCYFSYSLSDEEGKALRPSIIVDKLYRLFPSLSLQTVQWPPDAKQDILPYLNHKQKALGLLGSHIIDIELSEQHTIWSDLYYWFSRRSDNQFQIFQNYLGHVEAFSSRKLMHTELFGSPMKLSVSALETYRRCPYSYYLTYGLRLQERKLYQIEAVDTGSFYHAAIEQFSRYLLAHDLNWNLLNAERVKTIMSQIVDELAPQMQNQILLSSGRYQYVRRTLQKTLEKTALLLMEHGQRGSFVPVALEVDFGGVNSALPGYRIKLEDGTEMHLQGKIDRIEHAFSDNTCYLRIIDFKSGKQGLDLTEVYYGLKIQLLTYLSVALEHYNTILPDDYTVLPAGALYYFFKNGILSADGPMDSSEAEAIHKKAVRANGLLLADMHALKLADSMLSTGSNTLIPVQLLSKAAPYIDNPDSFYKLDNPMELFGKRNHTVVSKEQLELLMHHVRSIICTLGEEIHHGNIAIQPCRIGQYTGCKYCSYQAICQIQTVDFIKNSQEFAPLDNESIWENIASKANNHAENIVKGGMPHA